MAKKAFLVGANTLGLRYAENDVHLMKDAFSKHGYDVVIPSSLTKSAIIADFDDFVDDAAKTDTIVVYFSGHGHTPLGELHLILKNELESSKSYVKINYFTDALESCRAENKLIILDCCKAGAVEREWKPKQSERYRILTASERLQQGKELDDLKASFLTYYLHNALVSMGAEIADEAGVIRLNALYEWLKSQAQKHNAKEYSQQVPIPNLLGNQKANFEVGVVEQTQLSLIHPLQNSFEINTNQLLQAYLYWLERQHRTLELRGIRNAGEALTIPLERVFVALKADISAPFERSESRLLVEQEWLDWSSQWQATELSSEERRTLRWKFLARSPIMPSIVFQRHSVSSRRQRSGSISLGEAFQQYRWLVILGDPGSGKTTLARWITYKLADAFLKKKPQLIVPMGQADPNALFMEIEDESIVPMGLSDPNTSAHDAFADLGPVRLPVLVRVADFASKRKNNPALLLADYLGYHPWLGEIPTYGIETPQFQGEQISAEQLNLLIKKFLHMKRAVIILDGLDEIAEANMRNDIIRAVETFIRDWIHDSKNYNPLEVISETWGVDKDDFPAESGGNQLIITSRVAGYHVAPLSGRITHLTIEPMSDPAINRFCDVWSLAVQRQLASEDDSEIEIINRATSEAESLKNAIHDESRPGVRELASNPLLLAVLAQIHHNTQARLPEQRVRLYQIAVENLVEVWREPDKEGLTEDEVVHVLAPLAAYIHDNFPTGLIEESEVRRIISRELASYRGLDPERQPPAFRRDVTNFLTALRNRVGLLAARAEYLYGFLHLTFQEYLAARYLVRDPLTAKDEILRYINNPRWREPILLALGYASWTWGPKARERLLNELLEADNPLADLLPQNTLVVASALPELVYMPLGVVANVTTRLLDAYADQDGVGQYNLLRERVERTIDHLHNGTTFSSVNHVLEEALKNSLQNPSHAVAAASLILKYKWFTSQFAEYLLDCTIVDDATWNWPIDQALEEIAKQDWQLLPSIRLKLRTNLKHNPVWQRYLKKYPSFMRIIFAIYGGYDDNGMFQVEYIRRDSPLTYLFTEMIREGLNVTVLAPKLRELVLRSDDLLTYEDAALALVALSENITVEIQELFVSKPEKVKRILARINRVSASLFQIASELGHPLLQIAGAMISVVDSVEQYKLLNQCISCAVWRLEHKSDYSFIITLVKQLNEPLSPYHDLISRLLSLGNSLPLFFKEEHDFDIKRPQFEFLSALLPAVPESDLHKVWEHYLSLIRLMQYNIDFEVWMATLRSVITHLRPELIIKTAELVSVFPFFDEWGHSIRFQTLEILYPNLSDNDLEKAIYEIEIQESAFLGISGGLSIAPYLKKSPELYARLASMILNKLSNIVLTDIGVNRQLVQFSSIYKGGNLYSGQWSLSAWGKDLHLQVYISLTSVERVIINIKDKILWFPPPEIKEFVEHVDVDKQYSAISSSLDWLTKLDNWLLFVLAVAAIIPYVNEDSQKGLITQALHKIDENLGGDEDSGGNEENLYRKNPEWLEEIGRLLIEFAKYISPYKELVEFALRLTKKIPPMRLLFGYPLIEALRALRSCLTQHPLLLQDAIGFVEELPEFNNNGSDGRQSSMPRVEAILALADCYPNQRLEFALKQSLQSIEELSTGENYLFHDTITKGKALRLLSTHLTSYPRLLEKALDIASSLSLEHSRDWENDSQIDVIAALLPALQIYPQLEKRVLGYLDSYKYKKYYYKFLSDFSSQLAKNTRYQEHAHITLEVWENWVELGNNLTQLASQIGPPRYPNSQWLVLLEPSRQMEVVKAIQASAIQKTRFLTSDAVVSLDQLLSLGQISIVKALLPYLSHPIRGDAHIILNWLEHEDETIVQYATLLLAEAGYITSPIFVHLADIINSSDDRMRYRAAQSISSRREKYNRHSSEQLHVSDIGSDSVMKLAELLLIHSDTPRIATVLEYALSELVYDVASAVEEWILSVVTSQPTSLLAEAILMRIGSATPGVRVVILHALIKDPLVYQEVLLRSLASILQNDTDEEFIQAVRPFLISMIASDNLQMKVHAIHLIDLLSQPTSDDLEAILGCAVDEMPLEIALIAIDVYARLIAKMGEEHQELGIQNIQFILKNRLTLAEAASGSLVRLWISKHVQQYAYVYEESKKQEKIDKRREIFDRLVNCLSTKDNQREEFSRVLIALLFAGQDQDSWEEYHKELVEIIGLALEHEPSLIEILVDLFQNSVTNGEWPKRRITLAAVAVAAERMPSTFARRVDQSKLIQLIVDVARTDSNIDVRRFAVQTLSLMRRTTTPVASLLQALVRDVQEVQEAAIEACKRFREVDDNVIPMLLDSLYEESTVVAYSTTQLLAALGRSDGVSFKQRQDILMGFAEAIRDKRSRREVYTLSGHYTDEIKYLGSLHQAIYKAFLQVADVVGSSTV